MTTPLDLLRLSNARSVPLIRQTEAAECGLACLAMVATFHRFNTDISNLRRRFPMSLKGMTLKALIAVADEMGMTSRPMRLDVEAIGKLALPAILHWNLNHFVVLVGIRKKLGRTRYLIKDPAHGDLALSEAEFSGSFTGVALELTPSDRFQARRERVPFTIGQMWTRLVGIYPPLFQALILSTLMQIFVLVSPFYMQVVIDTAIPAFDVDFLLVLAFGFAGIALLNGLATAFRDIVLLKLGNALGYQIVVNLFQHLIRLPVSYFEKRHTGDVMSRFESTQPITDMVTQGAIQTVIDALMAGATLAVMLYYSPLLTFIVMGAVGLYIIARLAYFRALRSTNVNIIMARALESSTMIETIRGISALKLFAKEGDRQRSWQNRRADVVNASIEMGRLRVYSEAVNGFILAIENILFIYLAARMAISAELTIGMIFAFQTYKTQFMGASTRLVGQWVQYRLLDVHLTRIADIALSAPEDLTSGGSVQNHELRGDIELRDVHFSYGVGDPDILQGASIKINAGETVAIVGPSGGGKTTLLKLLLGFYDVRRGEITVDGRSLHRFGLRSYRKQIGAVLQDDVLYTGSLADNIAFFDPEISMDRVVKVSKIACIHDDIVATPMGYESFVGDMGSTLSGGQKQRVLLARALYGEPKILFLDEGTAHLDISTEASVNRAISELKITRLIIAHRPETIRMADRVVALIKGELKEVPSPEIMLKAMLDGR